MLTQLQNPIPLKTPKGKAWAIATIDYGPQWDLLWVTFLLENGECWTFNNKEIRQEENYTFGIPSPSSFRASRQMKETVVVNPWENARRPAVHPRARTYSMSGRCIS